MPLDACRTVAETSRGPPQLPAPKLRALAELQTAAGTLHGNSELSRNAINTEVSRYASGFAFGVYAPCWLGSVLFAINEFVNRLARMRIAGFDKSGVSHPGGIT